MLPSSYTSADKALLYVHRRAICFRELFFLYCFTDNNTVKTQYARQNGETEEDSRAEERDEINEWAYILINQAFSQFHPDFRYGIFSPRHQHADDTVEDRRNSEFYNFLFCSEYKSIVPKMMSPKTIRTN